MKCEIIVEIGQNHNGDMKVAKELIHAAKENGGDVAKFQLFDAKALFPTKEQGNEWFDYNCKTELSKDDLHELKGLYIAECSCERFNRYLDRALVVPTIGNDPALAFFGARP